MNLAKISANGQITVSVEIRLALPGLPQTVMVLDTQNHDLQNSVFSIP